MDTKRVLIVDDSSVMREMVAQTLRKAGFELRLGANGQEGLDRLSGPPVDLIVTDVYMPVNGEIVAVNEALRDDPALANTDPTGAGWFFKVKLSNPAELDALMDKTAYDDLLKNA